MLPQTVSLSQSPGKKNWLSAHDGVPMVFQNRNTTSRYFLKHGFKVQHVLLPCVHIAKDTHKVQHYLWIKWAAGKTQYNWGALCDIGIAFRGSLYRFTIVIVYVHDYLLIWWILAQCRPCVADITSSFFTFFLRVHNWNSTRGKPCGHFCTRRVSLRYRFGYRFGTGENVEKRNNSKLCTQTWMNYILQGIAFGSSPYRFPLFGAPFKKKERLTRRLLHEKFSRFLKWSIEQKPKAVSAASNQGACARVVNDEFKRSKPGFLH